MKDTINLMFLALSFIVNLGFFIGLTVLNTDLGYAEGIINSNPQTREAYAIGKNKGYVSYKVYTTRLMK